MFPGYFLDEIIDFHNYPRKVFSSFLGCVLSYIIGGFSEKKHDFGLDQSPHLISKSVLDYIKQKEVSESESSALIIQILSEKFDEVLNSIKPVKPNKIGLINRSCKKLRELIDFRTHKPDYLGESIDPLHQIFFFQKHSFIEDEDNSYIYVLNLGDQDNCVKFRYCIKELNIIDFKGMTGELLISMEIAENSIIRISF